MADQDIERALRPEAATSSTRAQPSTVEHRTARVWSVCMSIVHGARHCLSTLMFVVRYVLVPVSGVAVFVIVSLLLVGYYVLYVVLLVVPNVAVSFAIAFVIPFVNPKAPSPIDWEHQWTFFTLMAKMDFAEAEFYLTNNVKSKELVAAVKARRTARGPRDKAKADHGIDKCLHSMVTTQITTVQALIAGGNDFIETRDQATLSSVLGATILFVSYVAYVSTKDFVLGDITSKVHDALAILLPWLLVEEVGVGLSFVLLQFKHLSYKLNSVPSVLSCTNERRERAHSKSSMFSMPPTIKAYATSPAVRPPTHPERRSHRFGSAANVTRDVRLNKDAFRYHVNVQGLSVGVGATNLMDVATSITSLWTLLFLGQGYIVDTVTSMNTHDQVWVTRVYWYCVVASGLVIAFCYTPFFFRPTAEQREEFESVSASCEASLTLERLCKVQNHLLDVVHTNTQDDSCSNDVADGATDALASQSWHEITRRLRELALINMDTVDIVSFALYVVALSTYDFEAGTVRDIPVNEDSPWGNAGHSSDNARLKTVDVLIDDLATQQVKTSVPHTNLAAMDFAGPIWSSYLDSPMEHMPPVDGNVPVTNDVFPSILLRIPNERWRHGHGPISLSDIPVMGMSSLGAVLAERKRTHMKDIYDNPLVQEKRIYVAPRQGDLMCIGLEIKIMAHYVVSIYLVASHGVTFGRGPVYVAFGELQCDVALVLTDGVAPNPPLATTFYEVARADRMRAFHDCVLDIPSPSTSYAHTGEE